jgi:hypothetical protein
LKPRRPRHSAKRKQAVADGYRSALEAGIAKDLTEKGIEFEYERTKIVYFIPVRSGACLSCGKKEVGKRATYTPDFRLCRSNAFVESKGYFTARDRTKLSAVRDQHSGLDLRLLFAADNWCTTLHKQRYSEWASKHGFKWAVGKRIPDAWLAEGREGAQASAAV